MAAVSDATSAADFASAASNWAEHGMALAVRSVAATRLGRLADADNDTESMILSARRADASDPFMISLAASIWRRGVRGDEAGVAALRDIARQTPDVHPVRRVRRRRHGERRRRRHSKTSDRGGRRRATS